MLNEHALDQLRSLRLDDMVQAMADPATRITSAELSFEERLALLVQREVDWRDGKRLARLPKAAKLRGSSSCIEDINWRSSRGLDRGHLSYYQIQIQTQTLARAPTVHNQFETLSAIALK